jgi:hypothetical protein
MATDDEGALELSFKHKLMQKEKKVYNQDQI